MERAPAVTPAAWSWAPPHPSSCWHNGGSAGIPQPWPLENWGSNVAVLWEFPGFCALRWFSTKQILERLWFLCPSLAWLAAHLCCCSLLCSSTREGDVTPTQPWDQGGERCRGWKNAAGIGLVFILPGARGFGAVQEHGVGLGQQG